MPVVRKHVFVIVGEQSFTALQSLKKWVEANLKIILIFV